MHISMILAQARVKKLGVYSLFVSLLLVSQIVWSAPTATVQLEQFVAHITSATGNFTQTVKGNNNLQQSNQQSGQFAFERPGKFVWDIKQPYEQLVISDGKQIYQYDPDLEQVTQRSSGSAISNSPAALLFGAGSLADTFNLKDLATKGKTQWLRATPIQKDAGFVHVDIGFVNDLPVQLNLLDSFGQITEITFTDFKINPILADSKFKFIVPDGVDLVKMD